MITANLGDAKTLLPDPIDTLKATEQLVKEGYRMRVYVPFGTQWYPYLMRRLAERPANVAFITGNVMREMIGGRKS